MRYWCCCYTHNETVIRPQSHNILPWVGCDSSCAASRYTALLWLQGHVSKGGENIVRHLSYLITMLHVTERRHGQGLVEYAMIIALIATLCVGILSAVGITVQDVWYNKILEAFPSW